MDEYIERELAIEALSRREGCGNVCRRAIERILSADVAPVVHGRWIHYPDCGVTKCSHCGWSIEECWESKRCPECGAKMDGAE